MTQPPGSPDEPSDSDNLHAARGLVWYLVGMAALLALALLTGIANAQPRALAVIGALHSERTTWCEVDASPPLAAPAPSIKRDLGAPIAPPPAPPAATWEERELQEWTPGLGLAWDLTPDVMLAGGIWRTSQKNWAAFAIGDWRPLRVGDFSAGLFAGVSGGYCKYEHRLGPIGGITARVDIERVALHVMYVPSFGSEKNVAALGLAVSVGF